MIVSPRLLFFSHLIQNILASSQKGIGSRISVDNREIIFPVHDMLGHKFVHMFVHKFVQNPKFVHKFVHMFARERTYARTCVKMNEENYLSNKVEISVRFEKIQEGFGQELA